MSFHPSFPYFASFLYIFTRDSPFYCYFTVSRLRQTCTRFARVCPFSLLIIHPSRMRRCVSWTAQHINWKYSGERFNERTFLLLLLLFFRSFFLWIKQILEKIRLLLPSFLLFSPLREEFTFISILLYTHNFSFIVSHVVAVLLPGEKKTKAQERKRTVTTRGCTSWGGSSKKVVDSSKI